MAIWTLPAKVFVEANVILLAIYVAVNVAVETADGGPSISFAASALRTGLGNVFDREKCFDPF